MRRSAAIAVLAARLICAQNDEVTWDPREVGDSLTNAGTLLTLFLGIGGLYAFWRFLAWKVAQANGAHSIRIWLPTTMVALGWLAIGAESARLPAGSVIEFLFAILFMVNLPALPVIALLSVLPPSCPIPVLAILGTAGGWLAWYAVVRLLEGWLSARRRISLGIAEGGGPD